MKKIYGIYILIVSLILISCGSSDSGVNSVGNSLPDKPDFGDIVDGSPVLMFSDMESAPSKGWSKSEPKKGAAISIWGRNFGKSRNDSYITVGGVKLTEGKDYAVWGECWPTPFWQRITFYLNDNMINGKTDITLTVGGKTSNSLPFTIRDGRIFFVKSEGAMGDGTHDNPYVHGKPLYGTLLNMQPGDIWYYRNGTYSEKLGTYGGSVLSNRGDGIVGTKEMPMSFIAYPGEKPKFFLGFYSTNFYSTLSLRGPHTVFSGFLLDSEFQGANLSSYSRFVGNDVFAIKAKYAAGTGAINTMGSGCKIFGNNIHGGRSKDRFDHAVYFAGAPTEEGSYLGWNYIHDNDYGRGPEIAMNHEGTRVPTDKYVKSHYIFNNIVDANPQRANMINVYDLSWDEGEANQPEPVYIYNNIFLNGGTLDKTNTLHVGWSPALIISRDHSRVYNNIFYNTAYKAIQIASPLSSDIKNNIIVMNSDIKVDNDEHYYLTVVNPANVDVSNNLFFDMGSGNMLNGDLDVTKNIVGKDPKFIDPTNFNFRLAAGSPAIGAGTENLIKDGYKFPDFAPLNRGIHYLLRENPSDLGVH